METRYENYLKTTVKQAGMVFFVRVVGYLLGFVLQLVFARLLGVGLYGLYSLGFTVVNVGVLFSTLGMSSGAVRFLGEYVGKREWGKVRFLLGVIFKTSLVVSSASAIFLVVFRRPLARVFNEPQLEGLFIWFSAVIFFYTLMNILSGIFQGFKKPSIFVFWKDVMERSLRIAFFITFYLIGLKLMGAVVATVISSIIVVLSLFSNLVKLTRPFWKEEISPIDIKSFFTYSLSMLFVGFTYFLMGQVNQLILGVFSDSTSVGLYTIANTVAQLLVFFLGSFNMIFAPIISELYHTGQKETLSRMYSNLTRWIVSLTTPLFLWIVSFSKEILALFGTDYIAARNALIVLSVAQLVNAAVGSNGFLLSMTKYQRYEMLNGVVVASLNVVLNILLVPKYGVLGSAVGGALAIASVNIIKMIEVYFALRMIPYNLRYIKPIIASVIVWVVFMFLRHIFGGFVLVLVSLLAGFVTMFLVLSLLGLYEEDKMILRSIFRRLKKL
ncbi:flippase [Thermotoga sp. KOL6]|uniref:flippase n=1 Tax=Thermotoga sp. KOL6 TaxID=126741 RepID=UPI000C77DC0B|nr:flippase [Thermotoga sp. KOL6]PLV59331.1 hypothetical protein AS005_06215 [Thermotoga sp. KOL6]